MVQVSYSANVEIASCLVLAHYGPLLDVYSTLMGTNSCGWISLLLALAYCYTTFLAEKLHPLLTLHF